MEAQETIKAEVDTLLKHMGFICVESTQIREREGRVFTSVYIDTPQNLIGERGATLRAFQHVARLCLIKKLSTPILLDIDVNNYKKRRAEFLEDFARKVGDRVRFDKKELELEPMPAFDRRVVHCTLAEYSDLATESKGREPYRYIVVRPYP